MDGNDDRKRARITLVGGPKDGCEIADPGDWSVIIRFAEPFVPDATNFFEEGVMKQPVSKTANYAVERGRKRATYTGTS